MLPSPNPPQCPSEVQDLELPTPPPPLPLPFNHTPLLQCNMAPAQVPPVLGQVLEGQDTGQHCAGKGADRCVGLVGLWQGVLGSVLKRSRRHCWICLVSLGMIISLLAKIMYVFIERFNISESCQLNNEEHNHNHKKYSYAGILSEKAALPVCSFWG